MVAMSKEFQKNHPQVAHAVRALRHIKSVKPHVFKAFMKASGLKEKQATAAMSADNPPEVAIGNPQVVYGYSKHVVGDAILLNPYFVEQYEALIKCDGVVGRGPNGLYVEERDSTLIPEQRDARLLMESKLLHEMVHWGRQMVSRLPPGPTKHGGEVGWLFERNAYGYDVVSSKLGLGQYIADY